MGVVHVERNQPVHAPETADELTASAVAAPFGPGSAGPGGLAQMFIPPLHTLVISPPPPPPPDFWPWQAGGEA